MNKLLKILIIFLVINIMFVNTVFCEDNNDVKELSEEEIRKQEIYNIIYLASTGNEEAYYELPIYLKNAIYKNGKASAYKNIFQLINSEDMKELIKVLVDDTKEYVYNNREEEDSDTDSDRDEVTAPSDDDNDTDNDRDEVTAPSDDDNDTDNDRDEVTAPSDDDDDTDNDRDEVTAPSDDDDDTDNDRDEVTAPSDDDDNDEEDDIDSSENEETTDYSDVEIESYEVITQLTGVSFDENGYPLRDDEGNLTSKIQSKWMENFDIEEIDLYYLTEALLNGLFNKDPVVRVECLLLLEGIGPHPVMLESLLKASGKEVNINLSSNVLDKEASGETVGNIDRAFYLERDRILKSKYKYLSLTGEEETGVPFVIIRSFLEKVIRVNVLYIIEVNQEESRGLESVSQTTLTSLSSDFMDAFEDDLNEDTETESSDMDNSIEEDEISVENYDIPIEQYMAGRSSFKYLAGKSILKFDNVDYSTITIIEMTEEEKDEMVSSFIKGLENRNYAIRIKMSEILAEIFNSDNFSNEIKSKIVISAINSKEMTMSLYKDIHQLLKGQSEEKQILEYLSDEQVNALKDKFNME